MFWNFEGTWKPNFVLKFHETGCCESLCALRIEICQLQVPPSKRHKKVFWPKLNRFCIANTIRHVTVLGGRVIIVIIYICAILIGSIELEAQKICDKFLMRFMWFCWVRLNTKWCSWSAIVSLSTLISQSFFCDVVFCLVLWKYSEHKFY